MSQAEINLEILSLAVSLENNADDALTTAHLFKAFVLDESDWQGDIEGVIQAPSEAIAELEDDEESDEEMCVPDGAVTQ